MVVDNVPGGGDGEGGHNLLVDKRERSSRRVGAGGRVVDEGWDVGGGEEEFGPQIASLGGAGLQGLEVLLY